MSLKKELLEEFNRMENERVAVLNELKTNPADKLVQKPDSGAWSVAEVVMHMVTAEGGALAYMRKKLEYGGHKRSSFGAAIKQRLLNLAISVPIKYKAPKVADIKPGESVSFDEASARWDEVRAGLIKEYQAMDDETVGHELFKHPAAGKMNVLQSVRFMRQHMNRHIKQMHNTIKSVS